MNNINPKKSWLVELIFELVLAIIVISAIYIGTSSFAFAIAVVLLRELYNIFIQHKPLSSILYRLPILSHNGTIVKKHTNKSLGAAFLCEYIIFNTNRDLQIKVFITAPPYNGRDYLQNFKAGDTGTLHYRKGKKYLYFEEFEKSVSDSEEE